MPGLTPQDLAPGDLRSASLDLARFSIAHIRSVDDPLFETAYALLWAEFGARHEMERRETLERRLALAPQMRYELLLVQHAGRPAAVRDHTAIRAAHGVVVHLSHNLVLPAWRRTGLAGWMRALPLLAARELDPGAAVTLAAEMESPHGADPARSIRLQAYEKAGFRKVDPAALRYHQPDFRAPGEIDAAGGPRPLPLQLVLRRVGREAETSIPGRDLRSIVRALYEMYGRQFRAADLQHPLLVQAGDIAPGREFALLPPTAP